MCKQRKDFYRIISDLKVYPNRKNLTIHLDKIFEDINFKSKSVLDIGGGSGLHSFHAFLEGASLVDCIEPELDGSSSKMKQNFFEIKKKLGAENVNFYSKTFQEYDCENERYDFILTYNVINHLNEEACIDVHKNPESKKKYEKIFHKFSKILKPYGKILIADCGNKNLFGDLGIRNPFAGDIDWKIHQEPNIWIDILKEQGFHDLKINWSTFNSLGKTGRYFFENKFFAYLTLSHFYLWVEKNN